MNIPYEDLCLFLALLRSLVSGNCFFGFVTADSFSVPLTTEAGLDDSISFAVSLILFISERDGDLSLIISEHTVETNWVCSGGEPGWDCKGNESPSDFVVEKLSSDEIGVLCFVELYKQA